MKYWDRITALADAQRLKGLKHYGRELEDNCDFVDPVKIVEEAQQEAVDNLMYLEHSKRYIRNADDFISEIKQYVCKQYVNNSKPNGKEVVEICRMLQKHDLIKPGEEYLLHLVKGEW